MQNHLKNGLTAIFLKKNEYIKRHLIPIDESIWGEEHFEDFINKRSDLIVDKIKGYLL